MAFDITIGQYHHSNSVIHKLDPRIKITLMLVMMCAVFFASSIVAMLIMLGVELFVLVMTKIKAKTILKAVAPLGIFLLFPLVFNLLFISDGNELFSWGILRITSLGLHNAVFFTLRLLCLFLTATILTLSTSAIAISDALAAMLRPFARFGVPAYELAMMTGIALRFIPTLLDDFDHIRKAQMARGAALSEGGPIKRIKMLAPLLVPLFAGSLRHAETLALAMESRCYHGGSARTHYRLFALHRRDIVAVVFCVLVLLVMIIWL